MSDRKGSLRFFAAGTVGGMAGVLAGQPFDMVKVKMQTAGHRVFGYPFMQQPQYHGTMHCISNVMEHGGVRSLYKGVSSPLLGVGVQKAIAFGVFGTMRTYLQNGKPQATLAEVATAGATGGLANSFILCPIDQIKIWHQIQPNGARSVGVREVMAHLASSRSGNSAWAPLRGVRALYGGWTATVARETPGYAVYFTVYEALTRFRRQHLPLYMQPAMGGLCGSIMWALYYPLDVIKSRSQAAIAQGLQNYGWIRVASRIFEERGLTGFYAGVLPAVMRAFPAHCAVLLTYELVLTAVSRLEQGSYSELIRRGTR